MSFNYYLDLSERMIEGAKNGNNTVNLRREFYGLSVNSLESKLATDDLKKAFWVNIYNAYRIILKQEKIPNSRLSKFKRVKFSRYILSLNDIEYGILKRSIFRIGGYSINNPFYSSFIKRLALEKKDESLFKNLIKSDY